MSIEIKTIKTNRATMKYFSFGTGSKNLVLVPGVGIRSITLAPELVAGYYEPFARDYTVYVFDIREDLPDTYTIDGMVEDLYAALKEVGVDKACFNGCSMGGMILQRMEVLHPDIIEKAVLSSTTYHMSEDSYNVVKNWRDLTAKRELKQLAEESCQEVYTDEYYKKFYDALIDYHVGASELDCKRYVTQLEAIMNFKNDDLSKIDSKTLVVAAKGDKTFHYSDAVKMAEQIGCESYIYDGFSHAVYDEAPDFLDRIKVFFNCMCKIKVILASQSPRRKELLEKTGVEFEIIPSDVEEKTNCHKPSDMAESLASLKAKDVINNYLKNREAEQYDRIIVIGADTIVAKDDLIMGKPANRDEAIWMIKQLEGSTHQVYTGISICIYDKEISKVEETSYAQKTDVMVKKMTTEEIEAYVDTGEPMDKAGAYGIQGGFGVYVEKIIGDYNNVVGLPVESVYQILEDKLK